MQAIIESNWWDSTQTEEAKAIKLRKAEGTHRRKQERREVAGADSDGGVTGVFSTTMLRLSIQGTWIACKKDSMWDAIVEHVVPRYSGHMYF